MINSNKLYSILILIFLINYPYLAEFSTRTSADGIKYSVVKSWAEKLGVELWHLGDFITRRKDVQESFKQAQVIPRVGQKIVEIMANEIKMMMDLKISAVKRIMDTAENTALAHEYDKPNQNLSYYNAKEMLEPGEPMPTESNIKDLDDRSIPKANVTPKRIELEPREEFFDIGVNVGLSSVHVPTNVFDRDPNVIHAIEWSENLDQTFRNNYKRDPTLSWQYFGSATGFMRQFPASKWSEDPVDLFDCRLRSWFIEAVNSPKDVIILMDGSGSMTGQKLDIAKHVVNTILDTLGTNDFFNIYTFGKYIFPVVPCFQDVLAQATLENIREFKLCMNKIKTRNMANFTSALITAFDLLDRYHTDSLGAHCNQQIMIISDGTPFPFTEIFEQYNWHELPMKPVRVFTYLIGSEVSDIKDIKSMACDNNGYYVHITEQSSVREDVLKYIPVVARPLVLGKHDHPVIWTQVYADVVDVKMTDWLWEVKQNEEQKEDVISFREHGDAFFEKDAVEKRLYTKMLKNNALYTESEKYVFMTTVAMPAYDRRENATRIANILGVAGTDVPIRDIKKLLMPYMLGANGYAFIVTNNGFILLHPDFRPIFQGDILKPSYNTVDMIEVELLDDDRDPRDFNPILLAIRDLIINQSTGSKWLEVKQHYDEMKRVTRMKRQYYWTAIQNTPFTLVITYPNKTGLNRLQIRVEDEIHRLNTKGIKVSSFFSGSNWKIHPDWLYCKHINKTFGKPEYELLYFMDKMSKPGWKWPLSRTSLPPEHAAAMYSNVNSSSGRPSSADKDSLTYSTYYCDRNLVQALAFDARVTEWFSKNTSSNSKDDKGNEFKDRFGVTVAFLATHSGLTRWQEFFSNSAEDKPPVEEFSKHNNHAIDEIWYKRAVKQHFIEPSSFVYSVPFDSGEHYYQHEQLVTASHAIFHTEGGRSAPAAVVGFQFKHEKFYNLFNNITGFSPEGSVNCKSDGINCFILDNNGYIIISPKKEDTGKFFGEINGPMMLRLIEEKVYKQIVIYDYQAICFRDATEENNSSGYIFSPIFSMIRVLKWFMRAIIWYLIHLNVVSAEFIDPMEYEFNITDYETGGPSKEWLLKVTLMRTRLMGCDHKRHLYTLYNDNDNENDKDKENAVFSTPARGCERPFVVYPIPASNLILLVQDVLCPPDPLLKITTHPVEIQYDLDENATLACYKSQNPELNRKRPSSCINQHVNETYIELCGDATSININKILLFITLILILKFFIVN